MARGKSAIPGQIKYRAQTKDPERLERAILLAKNLNYLSLLHHTSKKELSEYLGVRYETITRYYNGQILPSPGHERKIAEFFDVRPIDLFSVDRIVPAELREESPRRIRTSLEDHLIKYHQLSDHSRQEVDVLTQELYWKEQLAQGKLASDQGLSRLINESLDTSASVTKSPQKTMEEAPAKDREGQENAK